MPNESVTQAQVINELVELRKMVARLEERISVRHREETPPGGPVNYRNLVEQIPAIVYTGAIDEFSTTLFVSPQVKNILGYTQEEYRKDPDIWRKRLHPEDRDRVFRELDHAISTFEPFSCEYRMVRRDGAIVWLRDEALIVQDVAGKPQFIQGVMIDITPQKRGEDELRRRDAVLKAVAFAAEQFLRRTGEEESIQQMLAQLGEAAEVSRVYIFENHKDEAGTLLTTQRYEWLAPGIVQHMTNPDLHSFPWLAGGMGRWVELMQRGEIVQGLIKTFPESERAILSPQGILSILATPVFVGDQWWGIIGFDECAYERIWSEVEREAIRTAADIIGAAIQNRLAQEGLRKSEQRFREFADQLPQPVFETDLEGRFTFVNCRGFELFDYTEKDCPSDLDALQMFVPADRDRFWKDLQRLLAGGRQEGAEYTAEKKDGSTFPIMLHATRIMRGTEPVGWRGIVVDISERKGMEEKLRESEERYRMIFNHSPLGVVHFDRNGIIVDCNEKFVELVGSGRDSIMGFDMLSPIHDEGMRDAVLKGLSGEIGQYEGGNLSVTGSKPTPLRCVFSRIDSQTGEFLGGLCIAEDFGIRLEAEEALRQSEARYRAIVEAQTELVSRFLADGTLTFVNEAYCRYFGESREELIGSRFWHHVPSEASRQALREHIALLSRQNPVATIEHQVLTSAGETRWQQWSDLAIFDDQGNIIDIQAVGRDITERKKAEHALQEAHQQLQDIIEFLPDATFVINKERKVIAWNRAIEEMTGVRKEDILGKSDYAHAVPFYGEPRPILIDLVVEDDEEFESKYDFVERKGNTIFGEVFVPKAYGGKGAYLWATASPLFDAVGRMIGAIQSIRDITERKRAEDAIHRSEKQLRFLSSRLLSAHEEERKRIARELHDSIGQSLAAVKFFVENTLKSAQSEEVVEIVESLEALVPMIQNAMQEARRIYTGLRPSILDDLGIRATIAWFCREFQVTYPNICIASKIEILEKDVPEHLKIVIFRVIQEAMNNIAKHSAAELVELCLLKIGNTITLKIDDNGTGFDLDAVLSKHHHERGLGLTGMKERTELSGGTFSLHSVPGEGTMIRASWPSAK